MTKFIDLPLTPENILNLLGVKNCGEITEILLSALLKRKAIVSSKLTTFNLKGSWYDEVNKTLTLYSGITGMSDYTVYFAATHLNKKGWISVKEEPTE